MTTEQLPGRDVQRATRPTVPNYDSSPRMPSNNHHSTSTSMTTTTATVSLPKAQWDRIVSLTAVLAEYADPRSGSFKENLSHAQRYGEVKRGIRKLVACTAIDPVHVKPEPEYALSLPPAEVVVNDNDMHCQVLKRQGPAFYIEWYRQVKIAAGFDFCVSSNPPAPSVNKDRLVESVRESVLTDVEKELDIKLEDYQQQLEADIRRQNEGVIPASLNTARRAVAEGLGTVEQRLTKMEDGLTPAQIKIVDRVVRSITGQLLSKERSELLGHVADMMADNVMGAGDRVVTPADQLLPKCPRSPAIYSVPDSYFKLWDKWDPLTDSELLQIRCSRNHHTRLALATFLVYRFSAHYILTTPLLAERVASITLSLAKTVAKCLADKACLAAANFSDIDYAFMRAHPLIAPLIAAYPSGGFHFSSYVPFRLLRDEYIKESWDAYTRRQRQGKA